MLYNVRKNNGLLTSNNQQQNNSFNDQYKPVNDFNAISTIFLQGEVANVIEKNVIPSLLKTYFNNETSHVGDTVVLKLPKDLKNKDGSVVIPYNSKIYGNVTSINQSNYGNDLLTLHFDTLEMPNGQNYKLNANVNTEKQNNTYDNQYPSVDDIINESANGATSNIVLKGSVATITENSVIPTVLATSLSSEVAQVGDTVVLKLPKDLKSREGIIIIPQDSKIFGNVTSVIPNKIGNKNASLTLHFDTLEMPNGQKYRLNASVATETGDITAGSVKSSIGKGALKTIGGAGTGAALGTARGAITGKTGKGAIYGTAFGGGLGLIASILAKGGEINVPTNEPLFIKLDSPLSINTFNVEQ